MCFFPLSARARLAPSSPIVASRKTASRPFSVRIVSRQLTRYDMPKSLWLPVGVLNRFSVNSRSSICFSSGANGNAFDAIVSHMMGLNSSFMHADVRAPAIDANVVFSSV